MTNVHIVILGLLQERPLHGYEVKHIIEDHMGDWTDIKFGSIYFALSKLREQGKVEFLEEQHSEGRPARKVYKITGKGRGAYISLLKKLWTQPSRTLYELDIAMFFMESLPKEEVLQYIDGRISSCERTLEYINAHEKEQEENRCMPRQGVYIIDHTRMHTEAELKWLQRVAEDVENQD